MSQSHTYAKNIPLTTFLWSQQTICFLRNMYIKIIIYSHMDEIKPTYNKIVVYWCFYCYHSCAVKVNCMYFKKFYFYEQKKLINLLRFLSLILLFVAGWLSSIVCGISSSIDINGVIAILNNVHFLNNHFFSIWLYVYRKHRKHYVYVHEII